MPQPTSRSCCRDSARSSTGPRASGDAGQAKALSPVRRPRPPPAGVRRWSRGCDLSARDPSAPRWVLRWSRAPNSWARDPICTRRAGPGCPGSCSRPPDRERGTDPSAPGPRAPGRPAHHPPKRGTTLPRVPQAGLGPRPSAAAGLPSCPRRPSGGDWLRYFRSCCSFQNLTASSILPASAARTADARDAGAGRRAILR